MSLKSFILGCFTGILLTIGCVGYFYNMNHKCDDTTTPIISTTYTDTVKHISTSPIVKDSIIVKYVAVHAPVNDTVYTRISEAGNRDSVYVTLPITQKIYQDSAYTAWVSGFMPALDSIHVYQPITTITNTEIKYRTKRWGIGIQVGAGFTPSKIEPYLGVGVTYNIFSW